MARDEEPMCSLLDRLKQQIDLRALLLNPASVHFRGETRKAILQQPRSASNIETMPIMREQFTTLNERIKPEFLLFLETNTSLKRAIIESNTRLFPSLE